MRSSMCPVRTGFLLGVCTVALAVGGNAQAQTGNAKTSVQRKHIPLDDGGADIIVTGTVAANVKTPSIAISVLKGKEIQEAAPISAADILKSVPGVFVNSSLGEVRNVVYSRGVSANSTDGASGYYYVSLQEDGLPVTNVTFSNFGPDFFYRPDLSLDHVEALRGGTAVVTGPNAPGGIFNYISRSGLKNPGVEVSGRFGLEGDGKNPYYRADAYASGKITDSLFYGIGGFYRNSTGARDPGYALNHGGQIKANLLWDYGSGTVQLYGKYLNDHNGFFEFTPGRNFDDPKTVSELGSSFSPLPPSSSAHNFAPYAGADTQRWDPTNLAHSRSDSIGLKVDHELGDGWTVSNNLKYDNSRVNYQTGAVIFPVALTDPVLNIYLNALLPGTYTYRDQASGNVLAQVNRNAQGQISVVNNALPNQSVLTNGVLSQVAYNYQPRVSEWMDQFSVTKKFRNMSFKLGAYYATSNISLVNGGAGVGVSPIASNPNLLSITYTGPSGIPQALTDPTGFAGISQRAVRNTGRQKQFSLFFGHDWSVTDKFQVDWGVRYENFSVKGANQTSVANPRCFDPTYGGIDGNVNTLYDNCQTTLSAPVTYDKSLDYVSFSGAATYRFDDRNVIYARYSQGKKAPDFAFFISLDSAAKVANIDPIPQKIQQIELGFRHNGGFFRASASPFYSKLSNVGTTQVFQNTDGTFYTPRILFSTTETYGVEFEGDIFLARSFNIRTAVTVQHPKSKDFAVWIAGAPGPSDDRISSVPDGDADNNPKVMATTTARFTPSEKFTSFITWKYLGERAANRYNTFYLPAFSQFDVGATYNVTDKISFSANINNALNSKGVMGWASSVGLTGSLDRQSFTPAQRAANPSQIINLLTVQPRAFYISGKVKF